MAVASNGRVELPTTDGSFAITDSEFRWLRDLIHAHTGIALSTHKRALLCSRLSKRLRHHRLVRFADYYRLLNEQDADGSELMEMINAITTNKTDFFREPHHFAFLRERLPPSLRARDPARLRVWSAGTSTGEEAYSIAMTLRDIGDTAGVSDIRILATDIDTRVLAHAMRGVYTTEQIGHVPPALRQRWFLLGHGAHAGQVRVKPELQELIRFRHLNLMDNPWPMQGPFDVIFCRNVIIYFDRPTQQQLIARFARLLRADGYLVLGHSESIHDSSVGLQHVAPSVYQRKGTV